MTNSKNSVAETPEPAAEAVVTNSVSPAKAKAAASVPAAVAPASKIPKVHVVSGGFTDTVATSALVRNPKARKSLSVHHLQRRLAEEGYTEAAADRDGYLGALTESSIVQWQTARGEAATGALTIAQARSLFEGDPNLTLLVDTYELPA